MTKTLRYQAHDTPFKRHLSFYDRDGDGTIYLGESLRANLSLGLDFPVALVSALGLQMYYGNTRPLYFGPFRGIEIRRVTDERNMLQNVDVMSLSEDGLDRKALIAAATPKTYVDRLHIWALWALAADGQGRLHTDHVRKYQHGTMLYDLEQSRKDRSHVLPLSRGGPISVAGHSWFVEKLFGVQVYQSSSPKSKNA